MLSLDFETYNTLDLKGVGADLYASSSTLVVTAIAWAVDDGPIESVRYPFNYLPHIIQNYLRNGGMLRAWNASFEWLILHHQFHITLPWMQVDCTMQRALYASLPGALDAAGQALGLPASLQKDPAGKRLMLQMSRPRANRSKWHEDDPDKVRRLEEYCRQDVAAERAIAKRLPPLPMNEKRVSALDHYTNRRGIALDSDLIRRLMILASEETRSLNQACTLLTNGEVTSPGTQTAKLTRWLEGQGLAVPDGLDKEAVDTLLSGMPTIDVPRQVLEIRQEVAKSSTKKLSTMLKCQGRDGRVRGQLAYYGANRTGRFAGRLIQVQNLPRPAFPKDTLRDVRSAIRQSPDSEWIDLLYGPPLDITASLLRSCLVPGQGKVFVTYDFKQIEARVLAWLAGAKDTLEVFASGEDVYVYEQKRIGLSSRQAGKVVVLACGFGMGAIRFQETARTYGLDLTLDEALDIVTAWRNANPLIVTLWRHTEDCFRRALWSPGTVVQVNDKLSFHARRTITNGILTVIVEMRLPSSRELFYRHARIEPGKFSQGEITYDGVDQTTKRWGAIRTWGGKLVENAVQAIARDCLVDASLRIDAADLGKLVLSAHDELVEEVDELVASQRAPLIMAEIEQSPYFARDLPIAAEGGIRTSYGV
jgi:DNA polymerase